MPTLNLMDTGFALWKTWAASLRDNDPRFAEDATLLCRLLDLHYDQGRLASASNLRDGLRGSIEQIVGRLLLNGAEPLKQAALLK